MQAQSMSFVRALHTYSKYSLKSRVINWLSNSSLHPPYTHVVPIGDPVLRVATKDVDLDRITSNEIQKIINNMKLVLKRYNACGISGPQLGVPISIFAIQCTKQQLYWADKTEIISKGMTETPFKVFINPKIKLIGESNVTHREGCCSMNYYSALVTRHSEVIVSGYNESGKYETWTAKNWNARIVQHEMDHLNGYLFVDKMQSPQSLEFQYWKSVNAKQGNFRISFDGYTAFKKFSNFYPLLFIPFVPLFIFFQQT